MKSNHMRYVSRESIEREIELQRIKREGLNLPKTKKPRKKNKKRSYHKRGPYKPKKTKSTETKKKRKKVTEPFDVDFLLKVIRECGSITREELVNIIKLPRTTIFDNLNKLMRENIIKSTPVPNGNRGRPPIVWSIK